VAIATFKQNSTTNNSAAVSPGAAANVSKIQEIQ
jgi:hypothetical protein